MPSDVPSNLGWPSLVIGYSPNFVFEITCTRAQEYSKAGMAGVKEYRFATRVRVQHPTGYFEYYAKDICFDVAGLERFLHSLTEISDGRSSAAKLESVGEMVVLSLEVEGRRLLCKIDVREFQPAEEMTTLHASFHVDYDLFVNKLSKEVREFTKSVRSISPEQV
jgi:hypothetical protein